MLASATATRMNSYYLFGIIDTSEDWRSGSSPQGQRTMYVQEPSRHCRLPGEGKRMMGFLVLLAALVVLDVLALRWGADSRDGRPNWG